MPELYILCQIGEQLGRTLSQMMEMSSAEVNIWAQYFKIKTKKQEQAKKSK